MLFYHSDENLYPPSNDLSFSLGFGSADVISRLLLTKVRDLFIHLPITLPQNLILAIGVELCSVTKLAYHTSMTVLEKKSTTKSTIE
jgi:hypothetical protein